MTWQANYARAPYFDVIRDILPSLNVDKEETISHLNIRLIQSICAYLDIRTPLKLSSEFNSEDEKTERLLSLLNAVGGTTYLSGPSADDYLEKDMFREAGIRLEYKSYNYEPYPQLWGPFEGGVTVLDLIANCGPEARTLIQSKTPNTVVVP